MIKPRIPYLLVAILIVIGPSTEAVAKVKKCEDDVMLTSIEFGLEAANDSTNVLTIYVLRPDGDSLIYTTNQNINIKQANIQGVLSAALIAYASGAPVDVFVKDEGHYCGFSFLYGIKLETVVR